MAPRRSTLWLVGLYAIAMAYLESAVVVYLRRIYGITDLTTSLVRFDPRISAIEVGREAATLVMLIVVGWIAGHTRQARIGYLLVAFGVWDIFYYLWLYVFMGWPTSLFDRDLLFLIPLPWWGPVLSPVLIAVLMVVGGARAVRLADRGVRVRVTAADAALLGGGSLLMLVAFMWDSLLALPASPQQLARIAPTPFL